MNILRIRVADISAVLISDEWQFPRHSHGLTVVLSAEKSVYRYYDGPNAAEEVAEDYDRISRAIDAGDEWVQVGSI